jgi:ABC-type glycerol-3-phosphate transport system substrate-binding protein
MKTKILSRRRFLRTAAFISASLAATGLVPTQGSAAENYPRSAFPTVLTQEKKLVSFWHIYTEEPRNKGIEAVIAAFEEAYPDIKVEANAVFHQDAKVVFPNVIKTSRPPDVIQLRTTSLARISIDAGLVMDITELYMEKGYDKRFGPLGDAADWKGKKWSIPFNLDQFPGVWYFKDVFERMGLKPPKTLDEFEVILAEFKKNNIPAVWIGNRDRWHAPYMVEYLILRLGGVKTWKGLTDGSAHWTDPEVVAAFEKFADWLNKGYFYPDMNAYDITDLYPYWTSDQIGMCGPCGPWAFENAKPAGRDADYFPFPVLKEGDPVVGIVNAEPFSISKNAPHPEEAKLLLDFLGSKEAQQIFMDITNIPMANLDVDVSKQPEPIQKMIKDAHTLPSVLGFDWDLPEAAFSVAQPAIQEFVANPTSEMITKVTKEIEESVQKWLQG